MSTITKSIDLNVPVRTAYNQWTQFEEFPNFMEGITEVTQLDDEHLHWKANIAGKEAEWFAEITEQVPDKRIAWISRGAMNAGAVTFQPLSNAKSKIMLQLEYNRTGSWSRSEMPQAWPRTVWRATSSDSKTMSKREAVKPLPGEAR